MASLVCLVSLRMGLHLCCLRSLALLQVDEQKFKLGGCVGAHKTIFHAPTCRVNV
jgi:hypothetical protein